MTLNNENVKLFAARNYIIEHATEDEFGEDYKRIQYIQSLLCRYHNNNVLNLRLLLNHFITLFNVFESRACARMLFFRIDEEYHPYVKTILDYLCYLPKQIPEVVLTSIGEDIDIRVQLEGL